MAKPRHHDRQTSTGKKGHSLRGRRKGEKNRKLQQYDPPPKQSGSSSGSSSPYRDLGPPKTWVFEDKKPWQ